MITHERFEQLHQSHVSACLIYARQFGRGVDVESLVQEAFVRLLMCAREPDHPRAWLVRTLRRLAIDQLRQSRSRGRREGDAAAHDWFEPDLGTALDGRRATQLLQALPDRQREIVVLRLWAGLSLSDAARTVGISVATAHEDFRRAMQHLRSHMETTPNASKANQQERS